MVPSSFVVASLVASGTARADESVPMSDPVPILGGELVAPCGFPTTVSVGGFCTGTLVHPRVVVFAAHCGDQVPWVRFGDRIEDAPGFEVVPEMCATNPVGEYGFGTDAAFCRFAEPVEDVPIIPPLMGCEAEAALQVGQAVTVVGFGNSDDVENPYGIKRRLDTTINALSWDEVFIGDMDEGVCYGDSGGPTYVQLDGGEWRSFGITSWGQPGCGYGGYLSTIWHNIEWIETTSGVDISPCHDGLGEWDLGPDCDGFDLDPEPAGGDWEVGCDFGPVGGPEATCGDAFDPAVEDLVAPTITITLPELYARFEIGEGATQVSVPVAVTTDDGAGWGVGAIELVIVDANDDEVARIPDPTAPFQFDNLQFPEGVWYLRAEASDRAGNAAVSDPVVFGVGVDPPMLPPDPEPTSSDSGAPTDTTADDTGPLPSDSSGDASAESTGDAPATSDSSGCGCSSSDGRGMSTTFLALVVLAALRRRRAALALALVGCGDSGATPTGDESSSSSSAETTTSTSPTDTSETGVDSSSEAPMPTPDMGVIEPGCGNGIVEVDEVCDDGNAVDGDGCSAACIASGTILADAFWPDRPPSAYAVDLAARGDGSYVALVSRTGDGIGDTAVVLGLEADASVAWSTVIEPDTEDEDLQPQALAVDDDGVVFAAGYVDRDLPVGDELEPWLARVEADGTLEFSSYVSPFPEQAYLDVVVGPSGDPIAFGSQELEDGTLRVVGRRHAKSDGATVWANVGVEADPEAVALGATITADGELLVVGWQRSPSGRDGWLGRFDEDGASTGDTLFGDPLTSYYPRAVQMNADGDAIVCGSVVRASAENAIIGRFTPGAADPLVWLERIEAPGPGISGCQGLAIDADGRVAIGGVAFDSDDGYQHLFARLSADGDILWSTLLGATPGYTYDRIDAIALDPDGNILAIGSSQDARSQDRVWIARITG